MNKINIQNAAIAYVCFWATAPIVAYGTEYRMLAGAAVFIWAFIEISRQHSIFRRPTIPVLLALLYIAYTILIEIKLENEGNFTQHFQRWIILFFLIVYESRRRDPISLAPVFWFVVITLPLWFYSTYTAFDSIDPHVARTVIRSSEAARDLATQGIGGYSLVYGMVMLLPILFLMLTSRRNFYLKTAPRLIRSTRLGVPALIGINLILGLAVIVRAGYTIAVILAAIVIVAAWFAKKRTLALTILLPAGIIIGSIYQETIILEVLEILEQIARNTEYERKINDIAVSVSQDRVQGTVKLRSERYFRSIGLFFENPFIGVLSFADVGKHSSFLDHFARYGILFGGIFMYLLLYLPLRMMKRLKRNYSLAYSVFLVMLIFPMVNNVFSATGVMLFVMFPVACASTLEYHALQIRRSARGVAVSAKACFGHPSPSKRQKLNATTYASGGPDSSSSPRSDPTRGQTIGSR